MSKENSDYKKSLQQKDHKIQVADSAKLKTAPANASGSREDSMRKQANSKKNKK